ncbi:MAG: RNA polymerase sporulation sigma factor SigK [Clostridia bacterium]|nr:RNA polymerase sporulation sigma factor SigK [Clostridia bacterium]
MNRLLKTLLELLGFEKVCGYVNSPTELPPPLCAAEETECIESLGADPETRKKARNTLIEHNLRLVVYIAKKFENTAVPIEDLVSIGTIGLVKAVSSFIPEKNIKLATYASRCIENEILMFIRKNTQIRGEISIDEPLNTDQDGNELVLADVLESDADEINSNLEKQEEKKMIARALQSLSERERTIIVLRFGLGGHREKTQKQVAKMLNISQSYISRLEKKIISKLKEQIVS